MTSTQKFHRDLICHFDIIVSALLQDYQKIGVQNDLTHMYTKQ